MSKALIMLGFILLLIGIFGNLTEKGHFLIGGIGLIIVVVVSLKDVVNSRKKVEVEGVARMVQITQQEKNPYQVDNVLNFRIECTDKEGNIINVLPVEMRGKTVHGYVADGDRVKVKGKMKDGIMRTKEALNISTNSKVNVK